MKNNAPRLLGDNISASLITLLIAFIISGCQEDYGQSRADSADASAASEKRLDSAVSSFEKTLGQQSPDQPSNTQNLDRPTLRWEPPSTREDGSPLLSGDIEEYRIYYRLRYQSSYKAIEYPAEQGTAFKLEEFSAGAYEFSVTAVDSEGRESRRSDGVAVDLI
ncbi:fibronectin type III domain-containing protein [Marinobacter sp. CHS3-4]|uniref:fibronectin type III domain-containing protein n=1 Tax=Marinobacter sp. CHS3-4 TaxID=3045174 RepID=UPI0024B51D72|nr:fibronectin type III domain-containing protein [Marinobacter sp. CHS3-4]MDI9246544.1 fibronectin type III domain-containing protein [Marinobacter sp. CHS3-4]